MAWIRLAAATTWRRCSSAATSSSAIEQGKPIAVHEFLYPLGAGVRLGRPQGRRRARRHRSAVQPQRRPRHHAGYELEPQVVMTTPLLEGLDGVEKMSKSLGNYVGVTEARRRDVRQADVDQRRAHVALLPAADRSQPRGHRRARGGRWPMGSLHPKQAKVDLAKLRRRATFTPRRRRTRPRRRSKPGLRAERWRSRTCRRRRHGGRGLHRPVEARRRSGLGDLGERGDAEDPAGRREARPGAGHGRQGPHCRGSRERDSRGRPARWSGSIFGA